MAARQVVCLVVPVVVIISYVRNFASASIIPLFVSTMDYNFPTYMTKCNGRFSGIITPVAHRCRPISITHDLRFRSMLLSDINQYRMSNNFADIGDRFQSVSDIDVDCYHIAPSFTKRSLLI